MKNNEKEWKMIIEPSSNSFIISLYKIPSYITYQNCFNFEFLHLFELFKKKNTIKEIISQIINLVDANNFSIEENYDNSIFILISKLSEKNNISLYMCKKENNNEELYKIIYQGNNDIKKLIKKEIKELKREINVIKKEIR